SYQQQERIKDTHNALNTTGKKTLKQERPVGGTGQTHYNFFNKEYKYIAKYYGFRQSGWHRVLQFFVKNHHSTTFRSDFLCDRRPKLSQLCAVMPSPFIFYYYFSAFSLLRFIMRLPSTTANTLPQFCRAKLEAQVNT
ncbi:hypothetical protein, partial [Treponema porcinum]|uniref:hypothetical protein n=1 Tax=Treponema porcinum TaxID=261392 RepID=UPI0023F18860